MGYVYINATLTGYAYETTAGNSIKAGHTKGMDDSNVEQPNIALTVPAAKPTTLGMPAVGAQGIPLWRRKESALEGN